ncbi:insulinase family protein [Mesobaculum littorinae]|uniref:Insulinase family protein n=1 Tax=Mesobaculum littorinae TaxID=2486419 RepID=A0A438AHK9_9RHOB|nr:pitrilysin family protein [Mesobaculum littorinae]RVV98186.1 insulinase family protein [Mesobaculum littorinae]
MILRLACTLTLTLFAALPVRAEVEIEEVTSPGGITAWLVEEHSIPFTALEIRFQGGAALDPEDRRGAVNLMAATLEEGTGDLDAQGFAAAREALAASFSFDASLDSVSVSAQFLSENREEAVDLLRQAIVAPSFDQTAIDRVRGQVLSIIRSNATDPGEIASDTFYADAFGDHPYGGDMNGSLASVEALTRDDIVAAHQATMARDRVFVGAVGDITPEELGPLLDELLGELPAEGAPMPGRAEYRAEPGVSVVPLDTAQSVMLFGHEGIPRDDDDFFPAYVVNQILGGGGFNSRLMEEVREKRGLTYGVGSYLVPFDHGELIMGQTSTANARAADTIAVLRDEWARIAEEGVTEAELDEAKTYLTGSYPLRFDGNGPIADILVGMQMEGLPIDYIATRNDRIEAVTPEDAARVARRIYRPEDLHFVVVGEPEGLEDATTGAAPADAASPVSDTPGAEGPATNPSAANPAAPTAGEGADAGVDDAAETPPAD